MNPCLKVKELITPCVTPFTNLDEIDYAAISVLIERLVRFKVTGIFPLGSTGVFPWLSLDEKKSVITYFRNSSDLKIYAGVSSTDVRETVDLAKFAKAAGCDFAVVTPPYYITAGNAEMKSYFEEVLSSCDIDFFLYNIPQFTGSVIPVDLIEYLSGEYSNVSGIKDSSGDMRYFSRLLTTGKRKFKVLQGQDDLLLPSLSLGGDGGICGISNISSIVVRIKEEYERQEMDSARKLQVDLVNPVMDALNSSRFPSGYYYGFYASIGNNGGYRTPMQKPDSASSSRIDDALKMLNEYR